MQITNLEIYNYVEKVNKNFTGAEVLPIKLNFYFQKNNKILMEAMKELEEDRMNIGRKYGTETEDGFRLDPDKIEEADKEYRELMSLTQELNLYTIDISTLPDDLALTTGQMDALSYMLKGEI